MAARARLLVPVINVIRRSATEITSMTRQEGPSLRAQRDPPSV